MERERAEKILPQMFVDPFWGPGLSVTNVPSKDIPSSESKSYLPCASPEENSSVSSLQLHFTQ